MKKRLLMLIPVALLLLCLLPTAVFAGVGDTFTVQSSDEPSVTVTMKVLEMPEGNTPGKVQVGNGTEAAVAASATEVTLPGIVKDSEGNEYTVTAVGDKAFFDCRYLNSVSFPQATTIKDEAFRYCSDLNSVSLPQATTIGDTAFSSCSALNSVSLPQATTIGDEAFRSCASLTSVTIWKMDAPSLGNIVFTDVPTACKTYVPNGAKGYTTANGWPSKIVDLYAVSGTVYTANNVPIVGSTVTVGDTSTLSDDKGAYTVYVEKDKETTITATKTRLGEKNLKVTNTGTVMTGQDITFETFIVQSSDEPGLEVVLKVLEKPQSVIPGLVQVGNGTETAVAASATKVTLPGIVEDKEGNEYAVTAVGEKAFSDCTALKSVIIPTATAIEKWAFDGCTALQSVSFPQAMTIGEGAFNGCSALKSVSLPHAMRIDSGAFNDCIVLKSVTIWQMDAPFVGSEAFSAVPSDCTLYVPNGADYTGTGWPGSVVDLYAVRGTVYTADSVPIVGSTVTVGDTSTLSDDKGAYTVYVEKDEETTITATKADLSKSITVLNEGAALTGQDIIFDIAAMPQFSLESGAYAKAQSVTLSCATVGATIRYTTNGEEPTETKGTVYDEATPILITESTIIKVRAFKEGLTPSAVVTRDYIIIINPFTDVSAKDWFLKDVMYALQEGLMIGTSDIAFSPNATTTRGMIVTILYRIEDKPEVSGPCPFTDVKSGIYYEDAMTWAASVGIVNGYGNGQCCPERFITREQLATMMYRYAEYKKYDTTAEAELSKYSDANEISSYAETAMSWAVGSSLIQGKTDAALAPKDSAVRSEVAAILHRFCVAFVK